MDARVVTSGSAEARLSEARRALAGARPDDPVLILGATRHAARRLTLEACGRAAFGWRRATLHDLARGLSEEDRQATGLVPSSTLVAVALVERALAALGEQGGLGRFSAVASTPGLPRAVWELAEELAADEVGLEELASQDPELARVVEAASAALESARLERPSRAWGAAARALRLARERPDEAPLAARLVLSAVVVALDVPLCSRREADLFAEVARSARSLLFTVPSGDDTTLRLLEAVLPGLEVQPLRERGPARLVELQTRLFGEEASHAAPTLAPDPLVVIRAAGEGPEAAELVREVLAHARAGTPLDRMAILLRSRSGGHVLDALRRARVPASPARGLVGSKPDPQGRAFLALLACAAEGLSALRFAEYLSFGEVPDEPLAADVFIPPAPEQDAASGKWTEAEVPHEAELSAEAVAEPHADVVQGVVRAPRRWEALLVDAAVVGGLGRWRRRLRGLAATLDLEAGAASCDEERAAPLRRRRELAALERFALPLLECLAELPEQARWGAWTEKLCALARVALRSPERVLERLAELHPLAELGPVALAEVRGLLEPRLRELPRDEGRSPFGAVFVAPVEDARGLSFDVVLIPGLAERTFPERIVPEPLLSDARRQALRDKAPGRGLATLEARSQRERLLLRIAVGAARERVVLSYPRIDAVLGRPRVPSFYLLDAIRAAEGAFPSSLSPGRRGEGDRADLGLPAPRDRGLAIDQAEHDLSLLVALRDLPPGETRGLARHLLDENAHLARALRFRWLRWSPRLGPADGLVSPGPVARRVLARHDLASHAYAATTLEAYAACPYRFFLRAIQRLEPREDLTPATELDAPTRGRLLHRLLFELLRRLRAEGAWPLRPETLALAGRRLAELSGALAAEVVEELAPPSPRVAEQALAALSVDVLGWLRREASRDVGFVPEHFELSFGLSAGLPAEVPGRGGPLDRGRDPASRPEPVDLPIGLRLRGSIDLVERWGGELRARDYKSGSPTARPGAVVAGGAMLQPILYALALEALSPGALVRSGGVTYVSARSGYREVEVRLDEVARAEARHVVEVVSGALAAGELAARPAGGACERCAYAVVCGPAEERRTAQKPGSVALSRLRARR